MCREALGVERGLTVVDVGWILDNSLGEPSVPGVGARRRLQHNKNGSVTG